ncbi:MAG: hypothetical protein GDA48_13905 [Hormoscilla sp. GM102CHS1]|nr:hypothetical protein [Hormoscilla sp. GM102CHS1]
MEIEFYLAPASYNDVKVMQSFCFDLPSKSLVYGDKAYNDYQLEDFLKESAKIKLKPLRKKNSKRKEFPCFE